MANPRTDLSGQRYQTIAEGDTFAILDTLSGEHRGHYSKEIYARMRAKRLNDLLFMAEKGILTKREPRLKDYTPSHAPTPTELIQRALAGNPYGAPEMEVTPKLPPERLKPHHRAEPHGKCWSKFGMVNADSASPVHGSIRNWGLKIKLREPEPNRNTS